MQNIWLRQAPASKRVIKLALKESGRLNPIAGSMRVCTTCAVTLAHLRRILSCHLTIRPLNLVLSCPVDVVPCLVDIVTWGRDTTCPVDIMILDN